MLSVRHLVVFFLLGFPLAMAQYAGLNVDVNLQGDPNQMGYPNAAAQRGAAGSFNAGPMEGMGGPQCWAGTRLRFSAGAGNMVNLHRAQCFSQLCFKEYDEETLTDTYGCVQKKPPKDEMIEDFDTIVAKKVGNKCFANDVLGSSKKCYCDEELCNSASTTVASVFLLLVSWTFL